MGKGHLREILERFETRVWTDRDPNALDELLSAEAVVDGLESEALESARAFDAVRRLLLDQFDDIRVVIDRSIEEGEWIAATAAILARHRKSGKEVATRTQMMVRIHQGRVVEGHNVIDFMTAFEQIGLLPERSLDFCLMGRRPRF